MNPPMNPNNYLIAMLDMYVAWLNRWATANGDDHVYKVHQFVSYNPAEGLYGNAEIRALVPTTWDGLLVLAIVSDGDDGGPTELTAWFDIDTTTGTNPLRDMVQGFDTMRQLIVREGRFVNLPEDLDEPEHHAH